jgi:hypothetical protein
MSYPVTLDVDYVERRSRLTTFFRIFLLIPLWFVGIFYGIGAFLVVLAAWFVLLVTGRWPAGMYEFMSGVLRFSARIGAYGLLLVDPYPPFGLGPEPGYPARLLIAPPLERYSRLKVLFRIFWALIPYLIAQILGYIIQLLAVVSWFVIVIIGRQPAPLQSAMLFCLSYTTRTYAFLALVTEDWPPFEP